MVSLLALMLACGLTPVRATQTVRLTSLVPVWAQPAARIGAVARAEQVAVELLLPWRDPAGAAWLARDVSDPASPRYQQYMTSAEFRVRFSPSTETVGTVTQWLRSRGLEVGTIPANRIVIPARGRVGTVERAFGVTLSRYRVGALALRAPDRAPALPESLARMGILIRGLDESSALITTSIPADPPPAIPEIPASQADTAPPAAIVYSPPCSAFDAQKIDAAPAAYAKRNASVSCGTTVAALRAAYGVDAALKSGNDGHGQTIVMIGSHAIRNLPSDLAEWSKRHGVTPLKDGQFSQFSYPGAYETPSDTTGGVLRPTIWAQQTAMLFETMRAIAPGANYLYVGSTSSLDLQNATLLAVDQHYGDVVVNGWYAADEALVLPSDTAPIDRAATEAAATGISLLWASGDLGDNAKFNATTLYGQTGGPPPDRNVIVVPGHPSVSFPAHNAMVTAVGATSLLLGPNGAYRKELGWAKSTRTLDGKTWSNPDSVAYRASGGGTSLIYDQPDYQKGTSDALALRDDGTSGRTVPDVSINGDAETGMSIGYTQIFPDGSRKYSERRLNADTAATGGFGAMIALVNQRTGKALGFANPALYALSKSKRSSFRDIVMLGGRKAGVRRQYSNASDPKAGVVTTLKTFEEFGTNIPRSGYDTCTGLGSPSRTFLISFK